jgi:hypothetical protein
VHTINSIVGMPVLLTWEINHEKTKDNE